MKNGDVVCEVEMDQFTVGMEIDDKGYLARICKYLGHVDVCMCVCMKYHGCPFLLAFPLRKFHRYLLIHTHTLSSSNSGISRHKGRASGRAFSSLGL